MMHSDTPLISILRLLVSDPKLRREFIVNPARVFKKLGLGCPVDFVGKRGKLCPIMPDLPESGAAREDIEDLYWTEWLQGGVDQLKNFQQVFSDLDPYPTRRDFDSPHEYEQFQESIRLEILSNLKRLREGSSDQESTEIDR